MSFLPGTIGGLTFPPSTDNVLSRTQTPVFVRPTRSIGGVSADVTIEEVATDELEITEHPVEQGANVADHAYVRPAKITIRGGVTNSSRTVSAGGDKRAVTFYEKLLELQGKREPIDVVTGKRTYKNMLIRSLTVTTDVQSENALMFVAECQQVLLVQVRVVSVPRGRQRNGKKTGSLDQKGQKQVRNRSAARILFGS